MQKVLLTGPTLRANLHTHTKFSDGAFPLEDVVAAYGELGCDVLAITDHNQWHDHRAASTGRVLVLSSNEPSLTQREHVLATGVHAPSPVDQGDPSCARTQEVIDWIHAQGGFSTLNHPAWSGMPVERLLQLQRYHSIEIFNGGCTGHASEFCMTYWDELLRRGRRVWGVATDDSHAAWDRGLGWIELFCEKTEGAILNALLEGRFYSSMGPRFHHIECDGGRLVIRCEPVLGIAVSTAEGPVKVAHGAKGTVSELVWSIPPGEFPYLRVELHRADGKKAWSNPIFPD